MRSLGIDSRTSFLKHDLTKPIISKSFIPAHSDYPTSTRIHKDEGRTWHAGGRGFAGITRWNADDHPAPVWTGANGTLV